MPDTTTTTETFEIKYGAWDADTGEQVTELTDTPEEARRDLGNLLTEWARDGLSDTANTRVRRFYVATDSIGITTTDPASEECDRIAALCNSCFGVNPIMRGVDGKDPGWYHPDTHPNHTPVPISGTAMFADVWDADAAKARIYPAIIANLAPTAYRFTQHTTADGNGCRWSAVSVKHPAERAEPGNRRCPSGCPASDVETDPTSEEPASTDYDGETFECERCGKTVPDEHFDHDAGLCDDCTDNNAGRVVL